MSELPRVHLTVIQPAGYVHSLGFVDQARFVGYQIERFGAEVSFAKNRLRHDAVNIVFGAHLGFDPALRERHACMFFNLEQLGPGGAPVSAEYLSLLRTSAVIDYDSGNVSAYCSTPADVPLVPFLHAPYLKQDAPALEDRPIDLLFFGSMNERRRHFIERIESTGVSVSTFDGVVYGPERDQYIRQAKAVLNCSFYETSRFEQVRASHCLSLGTPVISERRAALNPPAAFEDAVFWLDTQQPELFFQGFFGSTDFYASARQKLAGFERLDPVEAYADLMAFAAGFYRGHLSSRSVHALQPAKIHMLGGREYRLGWCNVSADESQAPDLILDLARPQAFPIYGESPWTGQIEMAPEGVELIDAGDAPAYADDIAHFMRNALSMLAEGGQLHIDVPVGDSTYSAHDPRIKRQFTEHSWHIFCEGAAKLGWIDARFERAELTWVDAHGQPASVQSAARMRLVLRKRLATPAERTLARVMRQDFGSFDDVPSSAKDPRVQPQTVDVDEVRVRVESATHHALTPSTVVPVEPAPLALQATAEVERAQALHAAGRHADALWLIADSVNKTFMAPGVAHHSLYYPGFDQILERMAYSMAAQHRGAKTRATRANHLVIATELYELGGHSKIVEELCKELENPVLVLTDLFGHMNRNPEGFAWIESRLAGAQVLTLSPGDLWQKSGDLHELVRQLQPRSMWYLSHHQDPIPFVGTLGAGSVSRAFVHHCDHNPSLGASLKSVRHVDITDKLQETCSQFHGADTELLRLYVADQGRRPTTAVSGNAFSTVTAGRSGKFSQTGPVALSRIIGTALGATSGLHYHIGPLEAEWEREVRTTLQAAGIDPSRFVAVGAVPSLWESLKAIDVAVYIGSAPVSGGRGGVEAQGCGLPVLFYTGFEQGSLLADYSSYADAKLGWSTCEELAERLINVSVNYEQHSDAARAFYAEHFSRGGFTRTVRRLIRGASKAA
jgi:hypothetical protein